MVNKELGEHIPVILGINKRTYHMITGIFAEKNLDFNKFVKIYIEKSKPSKTAEQIPIPISIFNKKLGMLESICLYLKDKSKLSFKEIADLLKRDYKTVYTSYQKAKKKK